MKDRPLSEAQLRSMREHDAWFRAEVEQGMREADDPSKKRIPQEDVSARWRRERAAQVKCAGKREG